MSVSSLPTPTTASSAHTPDFLHRSLEVIGIVWAWLLVAILWQRCIDQLITSWTYDGTNEGILRTLLLCSAAVAGIMVADLVSGFVHWMFDRYFSEGTFLLGQHFVRPFRLHHSDPIDITRHGFIGTNGNNSIATVIPLTLIMVAPFSLESRWWHWGEFMLATGAVATFATNQFHKWAHMENPPAIGQVLIKMHLALARDHHQIHHRWPYETHYCITTGWLNAPLVRIGFWSGMERVLLRLGIKAHRDAAPVYPEAERQQPAQRAA